MLCKSDKPSNIIIVVYRIIVLFRGYYYYHIICSACILSVVSLLHTSMVIVISAFVMADLFALEGPPSSKVCPAMQGHALFWPGFPMPPSSHPGIPGWLPLHCSMNY